MCFYLGSGMPLTIHCKGCHNPQTWDPDGGEEIPSDILNKIDMALNANGIKRNLSVLGGEPFAPYNIAFTYTVVSHVKQKYPDRRIYCWTGYTLEQLKEREPIVKSALDFIDVLIDGPFEEDKRDITLELRGSTNQQIRYRGKDF